MYFDAYALDLARTKRYDFQPALMRQSDNNKSFVSVRYYRLDSNSEEVSILCNYQLLSYVIN